MDNADELALVQAAQQGDNRAMAALLQRHARLIHLFAKRYGARDLGLEDAVAARAEKVLDGFDEERQRGEFVQKIVDVAARRVERLVVRGGERLP